MQQFYKIQWDLAPLFQSQTPVICEFCEKNLLLVIDPNGSGDKLGLTYKVKRYRDSSVQKKVIFKMLSVWAWGEERSAIVVDNRFKREDKNIMLLIPSESDDPLLVIEEALFS